MLERILLILISILAPISSFAIETFNQTTCPQTGMGGCFQNKTGVDLATTNLVLMMKMTRPNSSVPVISLPLLQPFAPDHYLDISWTQEGLSKTHFTSIDYSLIQNFSNSRNSPTQTDFGIFLGRLYRVAI